MAGKILYMDEEDLIDFRLYGIASAYSEESYFVYHLNRSFDTRFFRIEKDLDILVGDQQLSYYPVFEWEDENEGVIYTLIKNAGYTMKSGEEPESLLSLFDMTPYLIGGFKEYNYLMKMTGDEVCEFPISENNFIQKVVELELDNVKFIDRLIF